jgi:hypothetical protein
MCYPPQEIRAGHCPLIALAQQLAELGGGSRIGDDWPQKAWSLATI